MNNKIYKVKIKENEDKRFNKIHPYLLKPPFFLIMNAPPRSGKSNLIVNMIYNNYEKMFDEIIYISPNIYNDSTLEGNIVVDDEIIKISDDLENLDNIINSIVDIYQEKRIKNKQEEKPDEHLLLIIDDCLGLIKKGFNKLVSKYRHYCISIIITTQSFRAINNVLRVCSTAYIIFKTSNNKELEKMNDEFSGTFPDFLKLYNEATKEKYNFLYLNFRDISAYRNFDTLLYKKD